VRDAGHQGGHAPADLPAEQSGHGWATAFVRDHGVGCSGLQLEEFARQVIESANASRCDVEFARIRFGISDEFVDAPDWQRGVNRQDQGRCSDQDDRRDACHGIVPEIVERGVGAVAAGNYDQGVTVGVGAGR